jgi:hypothetical protein
VGDLHRVADVEAPFDVDDADREQGGATLA